MRGHPGDYDTWAQAGNDGWSFDEVLPFFAGLENDADFGEAAWHGDGGPLPIRRYRDDEFTDVAQAVALADEALRIAVEHVRVRVQFGSPIGSFQSPRHLLADASATLEGARALLDESWRYGGSLSALIAKAAAGRAHRAIADAAMQVCGAIGLTAEHDLHRYVTRGFQIDSLCGSHHHLEALLGERLFETHAPGRALPAIVPWG